MTHLHPRLTLVALRPRLQTEWDHLRRRPDGMGPPPPSSGRDGSRRRPKTEEPLRMRMRVSLSAALLLLTGCAGPVGPPFGPGPEADSVFEILLLLLFAVFSTAWQRDKTPNTQSLLPFTSCERDMHEAN